MEQVWALERLAAFFDGHVSLLSRADVDLARAVDPAIRIFKHFAIICDPPRHAPNGENYRKHLQGYPDGPHNDPAVEIHVRIEFALDEIFIMQGGVLQLLGD